MTQITRRPLAAAALLIAILAVVLFTGPPASAQSENEGLNQVTVSFAPNLYIVDEGGTRSIYVYLSDDPGREVIIPITATGLGGVSPADYSGVPQTVTFSTEEECLDSDGQIIEGGICYETSKYFTFTAEQDAVDDDGERVLLGFGAPLPAGVSVGWVATETVTIADGALAFVGLAQVGIGVTADVGVQFGTISNEAWQWQRSATEYGAYSDIAAAEGGTSNPYTPSAGDLGMWLKAKVTYDVGSSTGQTAQATTLQPVWSQAALSNAGFAYYNELRYTDEPPQATAITPLYAQGFTTGSDTSGYLLTAVRLALSMGGPNVAGTWAVHADDDGKPAAAPLSAAQPILNTDIALEHFTFREFAHPDGVRVDPDTKYWIVISQTTPADDGTIGIAAWGEWTGALEEGLAAPPVDPGSEDGWSVDFRALTYYYVDHDALPIRPELLPWQTFATGLELDGRVVLRMALLVDPVVTVQFSQDSYTVAEGGTQSVTVTLSADPERTVTIPIVTMGQDGATDADYSGVPDSVTFISGETEQTFTFTATQDTDDDEGESVLLRFGSDLSGGVSAGTLDETTVTITDDDPPEVSFGQSAYTVVEGGTVSVQVKLTSAPASAVTVPVTHTPQGATSSTAYSGVPANVMFSAIETSKSFTFTATQDTVDDDGKSVLLTFGTLPATVQTGTTIQSTVTITDDDVPAGCEIGDILCSTVVEYADRFPSDAAGRKPLHWYHVDHDDQDMLEFTHKGIRYKVYTSSLGPNPGGGTYVMPPFHIPERSTARIGLGNLSATDPMGHWEMPNQDYLDWTLYISTNQDGATLEAKLPFNEAKFCCGHKWRWYGLDLYELNVAWAAGKEYQLRIVEDPRADRTPEVLGPPLYLEALGVNRGSALVRWVRPQVRNDGAPPGVRYKVQWKTAAGMWDTPATVSEHVYVPLPGKEVMSWRIGELTPGSAYDVRVIAVNAAGDSAPSNVLRVNTDQAFLTSQNQAANSPATGGPGITGRALAGETLTATTSGIEDEDGLADAVFAYQWIRQDLATLERHGHRGSDKFHLHRDRRRRGQGHAGEGHLHRRRRQPRVGDQRRDGGGGRAAARVGNTGRRNAHPDLQRHTRLLRDFAAGRVHRVRERGVPVRERGVSGGRVGDADAGLGGAGRGHRDGGLRQTQRPGLHPGHARQGCRLLQRTGG